MIISGIDALNFSIMLIVLLAINLRLCEKTSEIQSFEKPDESKPETTMFRKVKRKEEVN